MHRRTFLAGAGGLALPYLLSSRRSALAAENRAAPCQPQDGYFEDEVLEDSEPEVFPEFYDDWDRYLHPASPLTSSILHMQGTHCPEVEALELAADVIRRVPVDSPFASSDWLAKLEDENEFGERYNA